MSTINEILKTEEYLKNIYSVLNSKQATMPAEKNLKNVVPTIETIPIGGGVETLDRIFPLEYIESTGTQYIDTECFVNSKFEWEMDFQFTDLSTSQWCGTGENSGASTGICAATSSNYFLVGVGTSSGWKSTTSTIPKDTKRHTLYVKNGVQKIDGVQVSTYTFNSTQGKNPFIIGAFFTKWGDDNSIAISNYCKMKVYSCKIYDSGTLIRDFKPCYCESADIKCLYELVNNKIYYNEGTGEFVAG